MYDVYTHTHTHRTHMRICHSRAHVQSFQRYLHAIYASAYRFPHYKYRMAHNGRVMMLQCVPVCVCVCDVCTIIKWNYERAACARKWQPSQVRAHMCKLTFSLKRNQIRHIAHITRADLMPGKCTYGYYQINLANDTRVCVWL